MPDMAEVGNEITNGMLWPAAGPLSDTAQWNETAHPQPAADAKWDALGDLLNAGIRGVREAGPAGTVQVMIHIDKGGSRDVARWFFDGIKRRGVAFDVIGLSYYPFWHGTLPDLAETLAFLAETYGREIVVVETGCDMNGGAQDGMPFPLSPDGQKRFLEALIQTVAAVPGGGRGVFYWAPEWVRDWNGPEWSHHWEARALFDSSGDALPALGAFKQKV